ncbi:MAG: RES family NAD+ phosphorylase [Actinobacteria bacterium]|nr:RES family NAD+ phosphorylase [Actinomycetota bacterium]
MSSRARPAQGDPPQDLSGFPRKTVAARTRLWRAAAKAPWWYCSDGLCRFDLDEPEGTCYLATDELAAVIEMIGPDAAVGVVTPEFLDAHTLYARALTAPLRTADLLSRRAIGFGVTNELSTMVPYDTPRRWSAALRGSGFDGISYRTRFDTGPTSRGRALFGLAGLAHHRIVARRSIDHDLQLRLTRYCHIDVAEPPRLDQLDLAPD